MGAADCIVLTQRPFGAKSGIVSKTIVEHYSPLVTITDYYCSRDQTIPSRAKVCVCPDGRRSEA